MGVINIYTPFRTVFYHAKRSAASSPSHIRPPSPSGAYGTTVEKSGWIAGSAGGSDAHGAGQRAYLMRLAELTE